MIPGRSFSIPVSNGLLTPQHCNQIGIALWVFLWCIDRTTKEVETRGEDQLEGLVLNGKPIRASEIANDLGIAQRTVHEHLQRLVKHAYLRAIDFGLGLPSGYAVTNSKKWKRSRGKEDLAEIRDPSQDSATLRGNPHDPRGNPLPYIETVQDKAVTKTKAKAQAPFIVPEWVPTQAWQGYEEMRRRNRKQMTDRARELAVKRLNELREAGHDPEAVLNQSTFNSWQGLFPLKAEGALNGRDGREGRNHEGVSPAIHRTDSGLAGLHDAARRAGTSPAA